MFKEEPATTANPTPKPAAAVAGDRMGIWFDDIGAMNVLVRDAEQGKA
jgi:hypothetical protein